QLDDALILASTSTGDLVLVDQHRAHERVLYERLAPAADLASRAGAPPPVAPAPTGERDSTGEPAATQYPQYLLEPLLIELTARQTHLLTPRLGELAALGIECQPFGGSTFLVRSVPYVRGAARGVAEEASAILAEAAEDVEDWHVHVAIALACRSA